MTSPAFADTRETHSGAVLMVGEHAYKLKKPVDLGFLDFRTLAQRRTACRREVELNRRLAPDVYLGLGELPVPGAPAEPLVVMRRMPDRARLATLVRDAAATPAMVREIARTVAVFHAGADRSSAISVQGTREALSERWAANITQCRDLSSSVLDEQVLDDIERMVRTFLTGRAPLFEDRVARGRILDGHGDLIAEDIFCLDDGPRILDCLEFDDHLRHVDELDDVSFLAMDLEHLGAPDLATELLAAYVEYANDPAPPALVHHFLAYRAFVRAKVSALRAGQPGAAARERVEALRHASLAAHHLRAAEVVLVLVGGPPGSGKSTLAGDLADRLGMVVLGSDRLRKELAGLDPSRPAGDAFGRGIYTPAWSDRTYGELLARAGRLVARGESVVLDASWTDAGHREEAARLAERTSTALVAVRCRLDARTADARLRNRNGISDADAEVARALRDREAPWPEAVPVDTERPRADCATYACGLVRPTAGGPIAHVRPMMAPD